MINFSRMDKEAKPWDFLDPNTEYVDEATKNARMSVCRSCEFFIKIPGMCKKCGCVMEFKTRLAHAQCPIGKWKKADDM